MAQLSLFLVVLLALVIPIFMARFKISTVPTAIAEIIVGIIVGSSGFNIVVSIHDLTFLSNLGVILLMFLSGMEINFDLLQRKNNPKAKSQAGKTVDPLPTALTAFAGIVVMAFVLAYVLKLIGLFSNVILAAIILLRRFKQPYLWFSKVTKATTQLDIRLAFFLIFALVTVAERVGAENILGAFLAGMVMKLLEPSEATKDKLTSIGYGFFIPIFFIMTGVGLNLKSLFAHPSSLMLLPVLVIFLFLAKAPVVFLYMRYFEKKNAFAGGFLTATTITIVLPTLQVARKLHAITSTQSDAFILAAVIVCIVSPIVFNSNFVLSPEDRMKETVTIVGANTFTVPVAHDLHDNWYTIKMFTDQQDQYETYDSRVKGLTLLDNLDNQSLERSGAFDCDIFVAAGHHDQENARMAEYAKDLGVKRAIARMNEVDSNTMARCQEAGVELFNFTNVRSALMRALIESPTVYKIMTDTNNVLYSVKVRSTSYTGRPLRDLEFVDKITVSRIRRGDEWLIPHGWTVIEPNDILIFSGEFKVADRVKKLLSHQN